jgi:hypothetical protein
MHRELFIYLSIHGSTYLSIKDEFNRLIASDTQRYFWTGGIVDHAQRTVFWANPNGTPVPFDQSKHWSHTGG